MKLVRLLLKANSPFVSYPKGDMIFGNFCWLLNDIKIDELVKDYIEKPKIIFSDFLPKGYLPKPSLPDFVLFDDFSISNRKMCELKNYIKYEDFILAKNQYEELKFYDTNISTHNSINRQTNSTDEEFKPYNLFTYHFNMDINLYILFDENFLSIEEIIELIKKMGKIGFGKKSSIGYGAFDYISCEEINLQLSNYSMSLSPISIIQKAFYKPYVKFGKFGNQLSYLTYKNPVILGDTGSIFKCQQNYSGKGLIIDKDIVLNDKKIDIIHQGYSIMFPIKSYEEFLNEKL